MTIQGYGTDSWYDGADFLSFGAGWKNLEDATIDVTRASLANCTDNARVRIWLNQAFDWDSGWTDLTAPPVTLAHGLDTSPKDFVVDLQLLDQNSAGRHNLRYGMENLVLQTHGAAWLGLTSAGIEVAVGSDETAADQGRVRMWKTISGLIFADDFESGDLSTW